MMDTIVAYSGGSLPCAIGIVRLTGEHAHGLYQGLFLTKAAPWGMLTYGKAVGRSGQTIDLCMGTCFAGPKSYTGEDMAEIYCHGSVAVVEELLKAAQQLGARLAEAGEFTKRAFLNGKLDLTAAEAVGDLIHAQSLSAARAAIHQLEGTIFDKINGIYTQVTGLLSHFYAVCDYTDEDIEPWQYEQAKTVLAQAAHQTGELHRSFDLGNVIKNGLPTAIIGKPNGGKSSILNRLLGYERAIVTAEAGTTRDTVEETMQIGGMLFRLIDTAGLRDSDNRAEQLGIARSRKAAEQAGLVICVLDGSTPLNDYDREAIALAKQAERRMFIINKTDVAPQNAPIDLPGEPVFYASALTGSGLEEIVAYLGSLVHYSDNEALITNARQAGLLQRAEGHFSAAAQGAQMGMTADALLFDAEAGLGCLGELLGKNPNADVVAEIFSKFCVGK